MRACWRSTTATSSAGLVSSRAPCAPSAFSCPSVDAIALTHAPCTPPEPWGQVVRAAKETVLPCESGSAPLEPSCIAKALAVPSARAAAAPRMANRNENIDLPPESLNYGPVPSLESTNAEAGAPNQSPYSPENRGSLVRLPNVLKNVLKTPEATWQHYVAESSSQRC